MIPWFGYLLTESHGKPDPGRWVHLFPGNYLLYGPLGLIFHTLLYFLGVHHPAVISLQTLDALCGAAGIFGRS